MKARILSLFVTVLLLAEIVACQTATITVQTSEPAVYTLDQMFKAADIVVQAKILSGEDEHYDAAVYKTKVLTAYKGAKKGDILYVGPYIGIKIGNEYFLFLRKQNAPNAPKSPGSLYGTVLAGMIMNQGYGSIETSYQCVFAGKEVRQQCDDAVRVCTDYLKLPGDTLTSPPITDQTPFGCRWIRKNEFELLLARLLTTRE